MIIFIEIRRASNKLNIRIFQQLIESHWQLTLHTLYRKCPFSELFRSVFSRILPEYGDFHSKSEMLRTGKTPKTDTFYPVRTRENMDQENSEYGHFLLSTKYTFALTQ